MEFGSSYILCTDPSERETITERELQEPLRFDKILKEASPQDVKPRKHTTADIAKMIHEGAEGSGVISYKEKKECTEYLALRRATSAVCLNISTASTPTWFAQKLYERGMITKELRRNAFTLGISEYDKVAQLLQAVEMQVKERPEKFYVLLEILSEESALEESVSKLSALMKAKQEGDHYETLQELPFCKTTEGILVKPPDTNIVALKLNWLAEPRNDHTGDAVKCANTQCLAILSHISKVHQQNWECEFCGQVNKVDIAPEEASTEPDTTYLLSPPALLKRTTGTNVAGGAMLVFCIDTSGSMCSTEKVPHRLRLNSLGGLESLCKTHGVEMESQHFPHDDKKGTYISRMETLKDALTNQLKKIANSSPSLRVALISFATEVKVVGDGSQGEKTLAGDRLDSMEDIMRKADELPMPKAIRHTQKQLMKAVMELQEEGQTALGPALLTAILLAGRVSGSKVVVCTDGRANVGLGNLDDNEGRPSAVNYYKKLGVMALKKGVTVSVITFEGTDVQLNDLSHVVHATRGELVRVKPKDISADFSSILAIPVIAKDANCTVVLHKELAFSCSDSKSSLHKIILGSVKTNTELSYEFEGRKESTLRNCPLEDPPKLPIQLQVEHVLPDGLHAMRVLTKVLPVTSSRETAEKSKQRPKAEYKLQ